MPKGNPGKEHPADCAHCKAVNRETERATFIDGQSIPVCKCHNVRMRWQKTDQVKLGGHWRCSVATRQSQRRTRLKKLGVSEQDYEKMLNAQGGVCAICGGPPDTRWKKLAVDHCHQTGVVRGLLCMTCNTMLGRLEKRWTRTMEYLGK